MQQRFQRGCAMTNSSEKRWKLYCQLVSDSVKRALIFDMGLPCVDTLPMLNNPGAFKTPFSVHGTSKCIDLPLNDTDFATFDPAQAPTLANVTEASLRSGKEVLETWLKANSYMDS